MAYVQDNALDIRLPQTPTTSDPKLYPELAVVYNAIRQLQYGVDQFLDIPSSTQTAAYTLSILDRGKSIDTTSNVTIPLDASIPFPIGATIVITNTTTTPISVIPTVGVTLITAGTVTTGTVPVASYGMVTIRYLGSDVWLIAGTGVGGGGGGGGGTGTVTNVAVATVNGFGGTVATPTTTPVITITTGISGILYGNGTAVAAAVAANFPVLNQNTTGTAVNVTGTVAIGNGGSGQITANAALNAFLPTQTSNAGKVLGTDGTNTIWVAVGGGGGSTITKGSTTVDFGASSTDVQVAITGQTGILTGSSVKAWLNPSATASNTADNYWLDDLEILAGNILAGTGFTIYAKCNTALAHGIYNINWEWN
jgi:hypothetical protein